MNNYLLSWISENHMSDYRNVGAATVAGAERGSNNFSREQILIVPISTGQVPAGLSMIKKMDQFFPGAGGGFSSANAMTKPITARTIT
jgi:hypothetical protein